MKVRVQQNLSPFPVTVSTIGKDQIQRAIKKQNGFPYDQLFYISDGTGYLMLQSGIYELNKGDFFYLAKDEPHSYGPKNEFFKTNWLCFDSEYTKSIAAFYNIDKSTYFFSKGKGKFETAHNALYRDFYNLDDAELSAKAYSAIITFFSQVSDKTDSSLKMVENFLVDNHQKGVTLDEVAAVYGHSKSKLSADFKKEFGMTVFEKLTRIRLEYANLFLQTNPSMTITEIARKTGFVDASYLCKMYKKYYSKSPKSDINL